MTSALSPHAREQALTALAATPATEPGYAARAVAGDQLRQVAEHAAHALTAAAANPGLDLRDLFATGQLLTAALTDLSRVLPHGELAAEQIDKFAGDRQAESGAAVAASRRAVALRERLKNAQLLLLADTNTGVGDGEGRLRPQVGGEIRQREIDLVADSGNNRHG